MTSGRFRLILKGVNILFAAAIPALIESTFTTFKYSSFSRGYYVYKDVWISVNGDESLTCEREEHNENDKNAFAIIWDDCVSKKIVGHVPLNWSKVASKFLQLANHHIRVEMTVKRVSRGVGLGLKIPENYIFMEMQSSYNMGEK